jgi:mono/diheme cytochrome c family protein
MFALIVLGGLLGWIAWNGSGTADAFGRKTLPGMPLESDCSNDTARCARHQTAKGGRGPALNRVHLAHAPDDALNLVIAQGIPPSMPGAWFLDEDDVANLAAFVRSLSKIPPDPLPGDAARGAGVYAKSGCRGCHILEGRGEGYGPELTGIGDRRSASFLKQAISKPSSALPEVFFREGDHGFGQKR